MTEIDPYPGIESWVVPAEAVEATLAAVRDAGLVGCEAGVFWLGSRAERAVVQAVVFPHGAGVEEHPFYWRVAPEVFATVARWAEPRGMSLLGVCHTHGRGSPAKLSPRDRTHSIKAPGVLAVVIGRRGAELDPQAWGWYVWEAGDYRHLAKPELAVRVRIGGTSPAGPVEVQRADASSIANV